MLVDNKILGEPEAANLRHAKDFIALYVIALMHGSAILLSDGRRVELRGETDNAGRPVVTAAIPFEGSEPSDRIREDGMSADIQSHFADRQRPGYITSRPAAANRWSCTPDQPFALGA